MTEHQNERDFLDALNDCVERLGQGQSVEECVRDYPQYTERLRDLLEAGALVRTAYYAPQDVDEAGRRIEPFVRDALRSRRQKRRNGTMKFFRQRRVTFWESIAAVFVVVFAAVIVMALIGPATGNIFSNIVAALNTDGDSNRRDTALEATVPSIAGGATAMPPLPTFPAATGTSAAVYHILGTTTTPRPGSIGLDDIIGTATALADSLGPAGTATLMPAGGAPTITASPTPLPTATARETGIPEDPAIVATSVVLMSPVPGTMTLMPTPTSPPLGSPMPLPTEEPPPDNDQQQPTPTPVPAVPEIIPLSAGEIDDNAEWDRYLEYRQNFLAQYSNQVIDIDVTERERIHVTDSAGLPVLGALVQVYVNNQIVAEMRTYATGETLFFPNARADTRNEQSFFVTVTKGNSRAEFTLNRGQRSVHEVVLDAASMSRDNPELDVLFLMDTTASMGDEIAQLQNNITHIAAQIDALPGDVDTRYGLVTYRDYPVPGDLMAITDFTSDVGVFQTALNAAYADGTNNPDWDEALNEAMYTSLHDLSWRGDDTIKLVFLVADARPHINHPQETHIYSEELVFAALQGVKIHPIASSGLEPPGEFIFRQIAQYTMGHFVFLTYEGGQPGTPGDTRPDLNVGQPDNPEMQQEGDYTVEQLDELVLRLITDELAALRGEGV